MGRFQCCHFFFVKCRYRWMHTGPFKLWTQFILWKYRRIICMPLWYRFYSWLQFWLSGHAKRLPWRNYLRQRCVLPTYWWSTCEYFLTLISKIFWILRFQSQQFQCICKIGFGGDGLSCSPDSDLDGWPDQGLNCSENSLRCKSDNCIFIPNSGQEDADNDGIGS